MELKQIFSATFLIALCMLLLYVLYEAQTSYSQTLPIYFTVGNEVVYSADTDAIYFGRVSPGSSSQRILNLQNFKQNAFKAQFRLQGKGTEWVSLPEELIIDTIKLPLVVTLNVPATAQFGYYSGLLNIRYTKIT